MSLPINAAAPPPASRWGSCVECWKNDRTVQAVKVAFCWAGAAIAIAIVPRPFVSGFSAGFLGFVGLHVLIQDLNVPCMYSSSRLVIRNRTWKHGLTGAAITGLSWGAGALGLASSDQLDWIGGLGLATIVVGIAGGLVAYLYIPFAGQPQRARYALLPRGQEPLVAVASDGS